MGSSGSMSEEKVHPNMKKSTGSEKASQVMGDLIWNLSNKAVLFSGLLKEEHPQNRNIHAKLQREERVMYFRKARSTTEAKTGSQWNGMEHPFLGTHKKYRLGFLS